MLVNTHGKIDWATAVDHEYIWILLILHIIYPNSYNFYGYKNKQNVMYGTRSNKHYNNSEKQRQHFWFAASVQRAAHRSTKASEAIANKGRKLQNARSLHIHTHTLNMHEYTYIYIYVCVHGVY